MRCFVTCMALVVLAASTYAQTNANMDFKSLLYSNTTPLTLKLKDLNGDWRHINVSGQFDTGGMMGMFSSMFGGGSDSPYYTKGDSVTIGGENYIIAYRAHLRQPNLMSLMMESGKNGGKSPDPSQLMPEKLTPETTLTLSLLNLKTCGNLTDIRPFDLQQEIAQSASGSGGLMDLILMGAMADKEKSTPKPPNSPARKQPKNL